MKCSFSFSLFLFACHAAQPVPASAPVSAPIGVAPRPDPAPPARSCEAIEAYVHAVDELVPTLSVRREEWSYSPRDGRYASELREQGRALLHVRSTYDGGCCSERNVVDYYLRDGEIVAMVDREGGEVFERYVFCDGAVDEAALANARDHVSAMIEGVEKSAR